MMRAAPKRSHHGSRLVAALVALVVLLGASWATGLPGDAGRTSGCACPCESDETVAEGLARDAARRPDCCGSEEPTSLLVAGVVGDPPDAWAPDVRRSSPLRRPFPAPSLGLMGHGMSTGPPRKLRVFLRDQALLI